MAIFRGTGGAGDSTTDATVTAVTTQAVIATTKASEAAASASESAGSASASATYAANAATSATSAGSSESESADSAAASANSAIAAANSATAAGTAKTNAETAETNAETAESNASTSATTATTKAAEAVTSASSASTSATTATTKAGESATSATSASTSATTATTKASEAVTSASSASTSAATATTKASEAETSATNAANSATAAATSAASIGTDPSFNSIAIAGEATMDGLTVGATAQNVGSATSPAVRLGDTDTGFYREGYNRVQISAGGKQVARFDSSGDISFYEDTGITAKMVWDASAEVLTTTGLDVTGTATMDGLTVDGLAQISAQTNGAYALRVGDEAGSAGGVVGIGKIGINPQAASAFTYTGTEIRATENTSADYRARLSFHTRATGSDVVPLERLRINYNGDISFYEDTGTTAKLFWDASAESLGIGTTSPADKLNISGGGILVNTTSAGGVAVSTSLENGTAQFKTLNANTATPAEQFYVGNNLGDVDLGNKRGALKFFTGTTEAIRIDSSGNVGIGTTSPDTTLHISGKGTVRNTVVNNVTLDGGTSVSSPYTGFGFGIDFQGRDYGNAVRDYAKISSIMEDHSSSTGGGDAGFEAGLSFSTNSGGASGTLPTEKLRIDSSGNVGIGVSAPSYKLAINGNIGLTDGVSTALHVLVGGNYYMQNTGAYSTIFQTAGTERMRIDASGNVGIGTTSPSALLDVNIDGNTGRFSRSGTQYIEVSASSGGQSILSTSGTNKALNIGTTDSNQFRLQTNGSSALTIDASQNVGIGTTSPDQELHVSASATPVIRIESRNQGLGVNESLGSLEFEKLDASGGGAGVASSINCFTTDLGGAIALGFHTGSSAGNNVERMRIDSVGNASFNTTSTGPAADNTSGTALLQYGGASMSRTNSITLDLNRASSDGSIINCRKDGTTVGSIGVNYGQLYIGTGDTGLNFDSTDETIVPHSTTTNAQRDAAVNLGRTNARFKDLYLSGGVYLGGTGAANKLEDYEEGTFNITVNGDATGVISAQTGNYVKIGKVVHIDCAFVVSTNFTSSSVGGLPFTPSIATSASSLRPLSIMVNNAQDVLARTGNGSTSISFHEVSNGTAHEPDTSSGSYRISGSYTTA